MRLNNRSAKRPVGALCIGIFIFLSLQGCTDAPGPFNPQPDRERRLVLAQTAQGPVAGYVADGGLNVFLGIPYAEPPQGNLRFAPPQPTVKWSHLRPAYRLGPSCPQVPDEVEPASLLYQDEDCLSLNVWTPGVDAGRRPVLVFIHGGGFVAGGTGDPLYNGEHLARRGGLVVVSLNYRVAALGFLALDRFGPEFAGSGNLGLQDQAAGLRWVKQNISRLGGDPDNVTIMGESAGSASVIFHMVSPRSKGLFKRVVAESGSLNLTRTKAQAEHVTQRFLELAGVRDVQGLRALPASRIVELEAKLIKEAGYESDLLFAPVRDEVIVPADPAKAFAQGAAAGIPLLNGTNLDEYRYWLFYFPSLKYIPTRLAVAFSPVIKERLGSHFEDLYAYYRRSTRFFDISGATFAMANDFMFRIPHIRLSDLQSRHAPVWMYRFDWRSGVSDDLGACHAIELPFVFRTFDSSFSQSVVGRKPPLGLSDTLMDTWIAFARTGNPNGPGLLTWPAYETQNRSTMIFNEACEVRDDPERESRLLYREIAY